jgi:hypothetical protein
MFKGRNLCIASMHEKEKVLKPMLEKELGVICIVPNHLNTDVLGTFSGEVERTLTPLETAKQKCILAMQLSNCDLAIASEGSFGPHPIYGFIPSDDELLFFYDKKNNLEIITRELSTQTNYAQNEFNDYYQVIEFASSVLFPSHGLILKAQNNIVIEKGITSWEQLKSSFLKAQQIHPLVKIETDMRAHFNPTRMEVIQQCAHKLIKSIHSACPNCNSPGFTVINSLPGLPCERCEAPTRSVFKQIYQCKKCNHHKEVEYPNGKYHEDPMYCDFCNP